MTIRPIREEDVPTVVDMMHLNWDRVMSAYHSASVVARFRDEVTPNWLRWQMAWKQVFVVEEGGEIIATGALADLGTPDSPKISVSQFFVRPASHGRGIGRQLLQHLVQAARRQGNTRLHVPSSRNAVPFYRASGFTVDAEQPDVADEITWMSMDVKRDAGLSRPN